MTVSEAITIAERYDALLRAMEDKAIARLNRALESAYVSLEKDLVKSYGSISSNATLFQSQRRALILKELGGLLQIVNPDKADNYEATFAAMLRDTTNAGFDVAGLLAQALGNEKIKPLSDIAIEAVAASAKGTYQRLARYGDTFADNATNIISMGIAQGWSVNRVLTPLQQQLGVTKQRADMIARTEAITAYNDAADERYARANIEGVMWIAIGDRRTCAYCLNRHLQVYPRGSMRPPLHPYCVTGDSVVLSDRILNVTRRYYSGDIFVIETASGNKLTITPNHPALTTKGWVEPKLLMVGDDLVSCIDAQRFSKALVNPDNNQRPTTIEEIFAAFSKSSEVATTEMPVASEYFHSDFGARESNVNIVSADSLLGDSVIPLLVEPLLEQSLVPGISQAEFLLGDCAFNFARLATSTASDNAHFSRFLGVPPIFLKSALAHHQLVGFSLSSDLNASLCENSPRCIARNAMLFGDRVLRNTSEIILNQLLSEGFPFAPPLLSGSLSPVNLGTGDTSVFESVPEPLGADASIPSRILQRFAGLVQSDRIVNITKVTHNGYVYNLETEVGYYTCNNIIIHNCRCTLAPWQESWRQAGIVDVSALAEQRANALKDASVVPSSQPAPFEKLAGVKKISDPIYTPVLTPRALPTSSSGSGGTYNPPKPKPKATKPKEEPINFKVDRSDPKALEKLGADFTRRNLPASKVNPDILKPYEEALNAVKGKMSAAIASGKSPSDELLSEFRKAENNYYLTKSKIEAAEEKNYAKLREAIKKKHGVVATDYVEQIYFDSSLSKKEVKYLKETFTDFYQLTGNKGAASINELRKDDPRAYATNGGAINIGDGSKETIFHEAFHHVEFESKKLEGAASRWRDSRADSKTPEKLSKLTGLAYGDSEIAMPDKYISPYVGKVYSDGATEVLSMGGEHFHNAKSMRDLAQKDPSHFNLIMGVLVSE